MLIKMCIHYSLLRRLASYKVCLCFVVLYNMVVNCVGIKISWILLSFLSMIIYEVLGLVFRA